MTAPVASVKIKVVLLAILHERLLLRWVGTIADLWDLKGIAVAVVVTHVLDRAGVALVSVWAASVNDSAGLVVEVVEADVSAESCRQAVDVYVKTEGCAGGEAGDN